MSEHNCKGCYACDEMVNDITHEESCEVRTASQCVMPGCNNCACNCAPIGHICDPCYDKAWNG